MQQVLERLIAGDEAVVEYFANAAKVFDAIIGPRRSTRPGPWVKWLGSAQFEVERACHGDQSLAKEIMPWAAVGRILSQPGGHEENRPLAVHFLQAMSKSTCSSEVKLEARRVARYFSLDH